MSRPPVPCPFCRPELGNVMQQETLCGYTLYVCVGCDAESPMHDNPVTAYDIAMRPSQQLAALREDNERLRSAHQRLFDLARYCRMELHDVGLISDDEYAILVDDPDSLARLHGYDSMAEENERLRGELIRLKSVAGEIDNDLIDEALSATSGESEGE